MTDKDAEQTPTGLRAMTVEEVREQFLDHVVTLNLEPVRGCNSAETLEALYGRLAQCNEIAREAL